MAKRAKPAASKSATRAEKVVMQNGKLAEEMMATRGWKQLAEPALKEMIESVIGRQQPNGRWAPGHFVRSRKDEKKEFYIGYVCALQEFNNSVLNYVFLAEAMKSRIVEREAEGRKPLQMPMVNDEQETEEDEDW